MKKVELPTWCNRYKYEFAYGAVCIVFMVMWISAIHHLFLRYEEEYKPICAEKVEIIETHIITDDELSLLYDLKDEYRCDTCLLITQQDAERLMRIAVVEDNTSAESQANVIAVVLNRVASPEFPNTVESVIRQPGAFSTVSNGRYDKAEPDVNSHLALAMVESGQIKSEALFFEASWAENTWQSKNLEYLGTIGGTKFYK